MKQRRIVDERMKERKEKGGGLNRERARGLGNRRELRCS